MPADQAGRSVDRRKEISVRNLKVVGRRQTLSNVLARWAGGPGRTHKARYSMCKQGLRCGRPSMYQHLYQRIFAKLSAVNAYALDVAFGRRRPSALIHRSTSFGQRPEPSNKKWFGSFKWKRFVMVWFEDGVVRRANPRRSSQPIQVTLRRLGLGRRSQV